MSRESKYTAVILKKQPFGESDEIITFFTKEHGKVRCLAKSVKKPSSKLQQKLQALFLVELTATAGSNLPKVIGAEPIAVFARLRENLPAMKAAFYCIELVLKFTPDEQKNEELYNLLTGFLEFLESQPAAEVLGAGLAKFKIGMLQASGLGLNPLNKTFAEPKQKVFFNLIKGGFTGQDDSQSLPVSKEAYGLFLSLSHANLSEVGNLGSVSKIAELQNLLSKFIEHQLERRVKSEKYLQQ